MIRPAAHGLASASTHHDVIRSERPLLRDDNILPASKEATAAAHDDVVAGTAECSAALHDGAAPAHHDVIRERWLHDHGSGIGRVSHGRSLNERTLHKVRLDERRLNHAAAATCTASSSACLLLRRPMWRVADAVLAG